MPFKKENIGKHHFLTVIEFGTGDISIAVATPEEGNASNQLWLSQHDPKPIEEWGNVVVPKRSETDELRSPSIVLRFTKIESIDTLIKNLNVCKESMLIAGIS